jgi:hypothetical protein
MLKKQKGFDALGVVLLAGLAVLALTIGVVSTEFYVIIHFVKKFW